MAAKNIVVFADGTGNSSAKLFKTNVWRLYQALDTTQPAPPGQTEQIAYYDDGVGASTFVPLAVLGGAFGWGLKRNVLDCYKFICRNYEPGDRIYLFGFSRGAFTVRVLAGLICREGLIRPTDAALDRYARDAYRSYRRRFQTTAWLSRKLTNGLRDLRGSVINRYRRRKGEPIYTSEKNVHPQDHEPNGCAIAFIGVWDTVAAYGMPIAEMTRAIDRYIWPLSMPDQMLHPAVARARHALALDDERDTFHPVLWDEISPGARPERIRQVWFAGMHADVGGGYPEDTLSYIPLAWMLDEAWDAGLRFAMSAKAEIRRFAASIGPLHDSRRGLSAYYRYQPRKISARTDPPDPTTRLMQDPRHETGILASVNIHESVLRRIAAGNDGYAPIVLNGAYRIEGPPPSYTETPAAAAARANAQERVWDRVWQRRISYFASLAVSICLMLFPLWQAVCHPAPCTGPQCLLAPIVSSVGEFLPSVAQPWIKAYAATPGWTLVFAGLLAWLLLNSGRREQLLRTDMRALWETSLGLPQQQRRTTAPPPPPAWIRRVRTASHYQRIFQRLKWQTLPGLFGIIFGLFIAVPGLAVLGAVGFRASLWLSEADPQACQALGNDFDIKMTCLRLKRVEAGERYRVNLTLTEPWFDGSVSASPEGFGPTRMPFPLNLTAPLKRAPSARWLQPLVKIAGTTCGPIRFYRIVPLEMHLIDPARGLYTAEFIAPISGEAQFFVNDLLLPGGFGGAADSLYRNNPGKATVDIACAWQNECVLHELR